MKKLLSPLFFTLLCLFIMLGCASKDFLEPGELDRPRKKTIRVYKANFQKTWKAAIEVAGNYPVVSSVKESGLIATDWIKGKSDKLYSGYGENRIPYTIRYKLTIKLRPTKKGTAVKIKSREQYFSDSISSGIDFSGSVYQWLDTESSTHKESRFLEKIQENLFPRKK